MTWQTTARLRALDLLIEIRNEGWVPEFVQASPDGKVHVVATDADQNAKRDVLVELLAHASRHIRVICGLVIAVNLFDGVIGEPFADERLCRGCHDAFPTPEDQALLFEANTDFGYKAARVNTSIRQMRRIDEDRQDRQERLRREAGQG